MQANGDSWVLSFVVNVDGQCELVQLQVLPFSSHVREKCF